MASVGYEWPYDNDAYMKNRRAWNALTRFATDYFTEKEAIRAEEGTRH